MSVVVIERTEGAGEEKVLFPPPSVLAAVALVPAFDATASLVAVSPVVDSVGGLDTAFVPLMFFSLYEARTDSLLCAAELRRDPEDVKGDEKDR